MNDTGKASSALEPAAKRELLTRLLKKRAAPRPESHGGAIPRLDRDRPFALSFAQQRMWMMDQLEPGGSAYNVWVCVRLQGPLDKAALGRTLSAIVARHETLRTVFRLESDQPVQLIQPAHGWQLEEREFGDISEAQRDAALRERCVEWAQEPFDLASGPLFRARLWSVSHEEHALGLAMHHIVADEWSLNVLLQELLSGYEAERRGTRAAWPPLPIQYVDYAAWQRGRLQGDVLEQHREYWRCQLSGVPVLNLPTDRPRPTEPTQRGAVASRILPAELGEALGALARREGTTLFMTLLAGFQALLHRYTGQTDISVGSPIANRTRPEVENLIGVFLNMLVLRVDLGEDPSFRDLLKRVKDTCLGAYAHQDMPFEKLVEELTPARESNRSPLFQAMLVVEEVPSKGIETPGLVASLVEVPGDTAKFDLTLFIAQTESHLVATIEYSTDLFDGATIERWLRSLEMLFGGIVANPDARLSALPLLTEGERAGILMGWNQTAAEYPRDRCLHELLAEQAARRPEAVAVVCGGTSLTYGELERRGNQLACYLRARGVGPDVLVGLCVDRSVEMVVGMLGILKAGGAYVPLDPAHPAERLRFVLQDTGTPLVVTQDSVRAQLPSGAAGVVSLDGDWPTIAGESPEAPTPGVGPEDLAYVIYTSGSTGKPKGVAIPHRAVVNFLVSMQKEPGLTPGDTLLAVTTLSFDIAALELLLPLTVGGCVVVASRESAMDGRTLATLLAQCGATVMQATPATWRMLIESGWDGTPRIKVLCGGEALSRDLATALQERAGEVWNLYGPTETTIWSTRCRVTRGEGPVSIGRPLANTQTYVLDAQGQPVPIGVAGELCIGGDGVARGYLNRPELTSERFVPDPFRDIPGARLYRTGDLARYRPDGALECLGRLDHQVKIRGFRIEPGEIEAELRRHPTVQHALVMAREDRPGDWRLVAYVVPRTGATPVGDELRAALRTALPEYMVPAAYVVLPALPLTGSGKIDRRALPAPTTQRREEGLEDVGPRSETERVIAAIWQELLGMEGVEIHANFFDLGGHSLLAIQAMHEMQRRLHRRLGVRELWRQSLAQVAARIDESAATGARSQTGVSESAPMKTAVASDGVREEFQSLAAFYFGEPTRQLFAVRHASRLRGGRPRGAICCYPLGQEYIRSHRAFEQLCNRLAHVGFEALRFDYSGTGDSAGDGDAGNVQRWTDDVEAALAYGRSAGMGALSLVGLRLGASLAALAGSRRDDVESLVLWHPVIDGCAYLEEARAAHRALVEDRELEEAPGAEGGRDELLGFPLPPAMRRTIEAVQLLELRRRPARRILLVELEGKSQPKRSLAAHLWGLGAEVDHAILPDPLIWRDLENNDQPLVPRRTLEHIAAWLDGNRP